MGAQTAVFIVAALYISIIFVFMCMAILALKTLSGIAEDKTRYNALYKLGASKRDLARALFKQTFVFFFLPFALPVLLSIPAGMICANLVTWTGYAEIAHCVGHYRDSFNRRLRPILLGDLPRNKTLGHKSVKQKSSYEKAIELASDGFTFVLGKSGITVYTFAGRKK